MPGIDNYTELMLHLNDAAWPDVSKNAYAFINQGSPTLDTTNYKFGGGALACTGADGIKSAGATLILNSSNHTIEGWFRPTSSAVAFPHHDVGGSTNGSQFNCRLDTSQFRGNFVNSTDVFWTSFTLSANTWVHLALVLFNGTYHLFKDGVENTNGNNTTPGTTMTTNASGMKFGYESSLNYFLTGQQDETRISNGIARYQTNFTPQVDEFDFPRALRINNLRPRVFAPGLAR